MPRKTKEVWPKVVVGSHLTVTTYEDGKTELKWDDEALARDVRLAILSIESRIPVADGYSTPVKKTRTKKVKA
jgi:hypothetical protein